MDWGKTLDRIGEDIATLTRALAEKGDRVDVLTEAREDAGFDRPATLEDVMATLATLDALRAAWLHVESVAYRD